MLLPFFNIFDRFRLPTPQASSGRITRESKGINFIPKDYGEITFLLWCEQQKKPIKHITQDMAAKSLPNKMCNV